MGLEKGVLVVDGDPADINSLKSILSADGFDVVMTDSGWVGLELARIYELKAAIIDAKLKDVEGIDILRQILSLRPDIKVIFTSPEDSFDVEVAARKEGIFYYCLKPYDQNEIRAALEAAFRAWELASGETYKHSSP